MGVVAALVVSFTEWSFGVLYPFLQEPLGASRAQLGLITSGLLVGGASTVLLAGWLVDVLGVRKLLTILLAAVTVGLVLFSQIQSLLHAVLLAALIGGAGSGAPPAYIKAIVDWVPSRSRGRGVGVIEASIPIGGIVATVLITSLAVTFGWRTAVLALAIVAAVLTVIFFAIYRDRPADRSAGDGRGKTEKRLPSVIKNRDIWVTTLCGTALAGAQFAFISYLVLYLKESQGMSAGLAGGLLAVAMAGAAVGRIMWGLASDLLLKGRRVVALALAGSTSVLAMTLMGVLPDGTSTAGVATVVLLVGLTSLGWTGLFGILIAELGGPALTGTAMGFAVTVVRGVAFSVPPLFGLIVDRNDSYDIAWWAMAGLAGFGTLLLLFLRPQSWRR